MRLSRLHAAVLAALPVLVFAGCTDGGSKSFPFPATPVQANGATAATGDAQTGVAGDPLPLPLVVKVVDSFDNGIEGAIVDFSTISGGGSVTVPHAVTDKNGMAQTTVILGQTAGQNVFAGTVSTVGGARTITFTETGTAGTPHQVLIVAGDSQTGNAGTTLPGALTVQVNDKNGNPCPNVSVSFTATGGATLAPATATTATNGQASSNLTLGGVLGACVVRASITIPGGALNAVFNEQVLPAQALRLVFTSQPTTAVAGAPIAPTIVVTVLDQFNNVVGNPGGTISLSIANNPAGATLSGTNTTVPVGGVANFSNTFITTAGVGYTLRATSSLPGISPTTSTPLDIVAGAPASLFFSSQPTNVTANQSFAAAVQVRILDQFGNLTNSTIPVTLALTNNTSGATLAGTTSVNATAGTATFGNLSIDRTQVTPYTLTASSGSTPSTASNGFSVISGAANKLAFTVNPPGVPVVAGAGFSVTVQVQDASGNLVTSSSDTISLSLGANPGVTSLNGPTAMTAVSGVATFTGLSVNIVPPVVAGYSVLASSPGFATTGSTLFALTADAATARCVVTTQPPSTLTAGVGVSAAVTLKDQFGNVVNRSGDVITLTTSPVPASGPTSFTANTNVNGVATFTNTLSVNPTGTYAFNVTDTVPGVGGTTTNTFAVLAAAPSQLSFSLGQPLNVAAASPFASAVQVIVLDQFGNYCPTAQVPVTLALNAADNTVGATLAGTRTIVTSGGIATFLNISIDRAQVAHRLAATSLSFPGTFLSSFFDVTPANATRLVFTQQPTNTVAGQAITPDVAIGLFDAGGNAVLTNGVIVSLGIGVNTTGTARLLGTTQATTVNGVATFPGANITAAGTGFTLLGTASGFASVASDPFNIAPDPNSGRLVCTTQPPASTTAGIGFGAAFTLVDQFGNLIPLNAGTATATVLGGASTALANFSNGVVTFIAGANGFVENTVGNYRVQCTFGINLPGQSLPFNITPAGPNNLVFNAATLPASMIAGQPAVVGVEVLVRDQFNNLVTNSTIPVSLATGGTSPGPLLGTTTVNAIGGVAHFTNFHIDLAGANNYQLVASSTAGPTATLPSSPAFSVLPSTANRLVFVAGFGGQPQDPTVAGAPFQVQVQVQDYQGNTVTTGSVPITLTIGSNPNGGVLQQGPLTGAITVFTTPGTGTATFGGLTITKTGPSYTLLAAATGFGLQASQKFDVIPTDVNQHLVVTNIGPNPAVAGTNFGVQVNLVDGFNNPVPRNGDVVQLFPLGGFTPNPAFPASQTLGNGGVNGQTIFTLTQNTVATFVIQAQDLLPALPFVGTVNPGVLGGNTILPSVPNNLQWVTQPLAGQNLASNTVFPVAPRVGVFDVFGNLVTTATNPITMSFLTTATPGATLSGALTISAVNGIASFPNLSVDLAGNGYQLQATSSVTATPAGLTNSFNVIAAGSKKLVFSSKPAINANLVAGADIAVTVEVRDSAGNLVNTNDTITLGIGTNPSSSPIGGLTVLQATGGVAAFNVPGSMPQIHLAGTGYTITAVSPGFAMVATDRFNIVPDQTATQCRLVFTAQPPATVVASNVAGSFGTVRVAMQDRFGNVVTQNSVDQVRITLPVSGVPTNHDATLSSGVAQFGPAGVTALRTTLAGPLTLTASNVSQPLVAPALSTPVEVLPAAETQVVFRNQPTNTTAAQPFLSAIQVELRDQFNNFAYTSTHPVTLSILAGSGDPAAVLSGTRTVNAVDGVATFTNLSIDKANIPPQTAYTLVATDPVTTDTDNSAAFNVVVGGPNKLVVTTQPASTTAGQDVTFVVQVQDQAGNLVTSATNLITIGLGSNPSGSSLLGVISMNAGGGVATFGAGNAPRIPTSGTGYTLSVGAVGFSSIVTAPFNVTAGLANHLTFTTQPPAAVIAAGPLAPNFGAVVTVEDAFGNPVIGTTDTIQINVNGINFTSNVVPATGQATFSNSLYISKTGTYALAATDLTVPAVTATQSQVVFVGAAAADHLVFTTQPQNVSAGSIFALPIRLEVRDVFDNLAPVTHSVSIAITPPAGAAVLSGTTPKLSIGGVVEFSDLSINLTGGYSLTATDALLPFPTVASNAFNVVAPASNRLVVTSGPTGPINAGQPIAFTVTVLDASGTPVNVPAVDLTVSMGQNPTNAILGGATVANNGGGSTFTFAGLSAPTLNTTGTYTLLVSAPGYSTASTQQFAIVPETTARRLVFSIQPPASPLTVTSTAGPNPQITAEVSVVDLFGNLDTTGYNGDTIQITVPGQAGSVSQPIALGKASFTGTLNVLLSGVTNLNAGITTGSALVPAPGSSNSFTVVAGTKFQLAFIGTPVPIAPTAGLPFPVAIVVEVRDAQGNRVTTAEDVISLNRVAGPLGTLTGATTVTATNGVARFQTVILDVAGAGYQLTASAAVAPPATTAPTAAFTVNANTGNRFVITGVPATVVAGAPIAFTVTTVDAAGNTINTGAAGLTVTLSLGTDPTSTSTGLFGQQQLTVAAATPGVFNFNGPSVHTAGVGYTILVSAPGYPTQATTLFDVTGDTNPAQLQLVYTTQPQSVVTASNVANFGAVLQLRDQFGNPITPAGANTVTVAAANLNGTGSRTTNFVGSTATFVGATGLFNTLAGNYVLTATSTVTGPTGYLSTPFTVAPGSTFRLGWLVEPQNATSNETFALTPRVAAFDQFSNFIPTANDPVSITIENNGATPQVSRLKGALQMYMQDGVAAFQNLSIDLASNPGNPYTLRASSATPGVAFAISAPFTVSGLNTVRLVFSTPIVTPFEAGTLFSVTVSLVDQAGNLVTTGPLASTTPITLALGSNPTAATLFVGAAQGAVTQTTASGQTTFNGVTVRKTGTNYTLVASAPNFGNVASNAFTVIPDQTNAQHLQVTYLGPTVATAGVPFGIQVTLLDQFNNIVPRSFVPDSVTLTPIGGLTVPPAAQTLLNGTTIFVVTQNTVGANFGATAIDVAAPFVVNNGSVTGITVGPANPHHLQWITQPAPAQQIPSNSIFPAAVRVGVYDQFNNLVTTATDPVTIARATGPGTSVLSGSTTVSAVNGVATFQTLSLDLIANNYSLVATSTSPGVAATTAFAPVASTFEIVPASPNHLVFTVKPAALSSVVAGSNISFTVEVRDAANNLVQLNGQTVTLGLGLNNPDRPLGNNPPAAGLYGTVTRPVVNGVATFAGGNRPAIRTAGNYTVTASVPGFEVIASDPFNVAPEQNGANAALVFVQGPPSSVRAVLAHQNLANNGFGNVMVALEDRFGNVVTQNNTETVTILLADAPVVGTLTFNATLTGGIATFSAGNGNGLFAKVAGTSALTATVTTGPQTGLAGTSTPVTVTNAPASQVAFTAQPQDATAGSPFLSSVNVEIRDQFGNRALNSTNPVRMTTFFGPSALSGATTVNAVDGVATFTNLSLATASLYQLQAQDLGTSATALSNTPGINTPNFQVVAAGASKLVVTAQPTGPITAGGDILFTVQIQDASGNLVSTAAGELTVGIGTNPSGGAIGGTTKLSTVNGVFQFVAAATPTIAKAGTDYTLSLGAVGFSTISTQPFNVIAGARDHLVFTVQPPTTVVAAGVGTENFGAQVTVVDSLGNPVPGLADTISLSVNGVTFGPVAVSAATVGPVPAGTAVFGNTSLYISKTGTFTVHAVDNTAGVTAADSNQIHVTPAAADHVVFTVQPVNVAEGSFFAAPVTLNVVDAFGNLVSNDNTTQVTMTIVPAAPPVLNGTVLKTAVNGVLVFNDLSVTGVGGPYTLQPVEALAGVSPASNAFNVLSPAGNRLVLTTPPGASIAAGAPIAFDVEVRDATGTTTQAVNVTVTVALGTNPTGALLSGVTDLTDTDGSVSFVGANAPTITKATTGAQYYTLLISAPGYATISTDKIQITPAAVAGGRFLSFATQPPVAPVTVTSSNAGTPLFPQIDVQVVDQFGNVDPAYDGEEVNVNVVGEVAVFGPTTIQAANHRATFAANSTIFARVAQSAAQLQATYDAGNTVAPIPALALSNPFKVVPGATNKLTFTGPTPSSVTAGVEFSSSVSVQIRDAQDNLVTTATDVVTLATTLGSPSGLFGATSVAASHGIATFSNVYVTVAGGPYNLHATSGVLTATAPDMGPFNAGENTGDRLFIEVEPAATVTAGAPIAFTVVARDSAGNVVTIPPAGSFNVNLSLGSASVTTATLQGTIFGATGPGPARVVFNLANGAPFVGTAGTYTILASAQGYDTASTRTFTIQPDTANARLVFRQQPPSTVTASDNTGPNFGAIVQITDQFGNPLGAAAAGATVTLQALPVVGAVPAPFAGLATATDTANFASPPALFVSRTGSWLLRATSTLTGAATFDSSSFTVAPAASFQLHFIQQPQNVSASQPFANALTVGVFDRFNNFIPTATDPVQMSIAFNAGTPGPGTLSGATLVNAVDGIAVFQTLNIDRASAVSQQYTLRAASPIAALPLLTPEVSSGFVVSAATPNHFQITQQPAAIQIAGQVVRFTVVVVDAAGNPVPNGSVGPVDIQFTIGQNPNPNVAFLQGVTQFSTVNQGTFISDPSTPPSTFGGAGGPFITKVGNGYTLLVSAPGFPTIATTPFNIIPSVPQQLIFTRQPPAIVSASNPSAPTPPGPYFPNFGCEVTLADQFGNAVTPPGAPNDGFQITAVPVFPTIYTPVLNVENFPPTAVSNFGDGSIARPFQLFIERTGTYRLRVVLNPAAGPPPQFPALSNVITVVAGPPRTLIFLDHPSDTISNVVSQTPVRVAVQDGLGNVNEQALNRLQLRLVEPSLGPINSSNTTAILSGMLVTNAVDGIATFPNLSVDKVGTYRLVVDDISQLPLTQTLFPNTVSNPFNVTQNSPFKLVLTRSWAAGTNFTAGTPIGVAPGPSFEVQVQDQAGNLVTGYNTRLTISMGSNAAGAHLNGTIELSDAGTGIYTFNPTIDLANANTTPSFTPYTIQIMGTNFGPIGTPVPNPGVGIENFFTISTQPFNVVPDVANHLTIARQPQPIVTASNGTTIAPIDSHNTIDLTITQRDRFENVVLTTLPGLDTVNLTLQDRDANTVTGTVGLNTSNIPGLSVSSTNGVFTFSTATANGLYVPASGIYRIHADRTTGSLLSIDTDEFRIEASAATQLVFLSPYDVGPLANQNSLVPLQPAPAIAIQDAFGNVVPSANNSVTLTIASGPVNGVLYGPITVSAAAGIASFPGVSLDLVGTYQLQGVSGGLTATPNSTDVVIEPGSPYRIVVLEQWNSTLFTPATFTAGDVPGAGVTIGTVLTGSGLTGYRVQLQDQAGNPATLYANQIFRLNVSLGENPTGAVLLGNLNARVTGTAIGAQATIDFTNNTLKVANVDGPPARTRPYTIHIDGTIQTNSGISQVTSSVIGVDTVTFNILPAAENKVVFVQQPPVVLTASNGTAPNPTFSVQVQTQDAFGNIARVFHVMHLELYRAEDFDQAAKDAFGDPVTLQPIDIVLAAPVGSFDHTVPSPALAATFLPGGVGFGTQNYNFTNLSIPRTGRYILRARNTHGFPAIGGNSIQFEVRDSGATQLVQVGSVNDQFAGAHFDQAVRFAVQDQYGNVVTSYNEPVSLAIDPATGPQSPATLGQLSGPITVTATAGMVNFNANAIDRVGLTGTGTAYQLTATASATAITPALTVNTNAFQVLPAPAYRLVVTNQWTSTVFAAASFTAGQNIGASGYTVELQDQNGNPADLPAGQILRLNARIGENPTGAVLNGQLNARFGSPTAITPGPINFTFNNTITKSNIDTNRTRPYTIQIVGTIQDTISNVTSSLIPVETVPFNINPDAESQVVFVQQPPVFLTASDGNTGIDHPTFRVQVQTQDQFGNIARVFHQMHLELYDAVQFDQAAKDLVTGDPLTLQPIDVQLATPVGSFNHAAATPAPFQNATFGPPPFFASQNYDFNGLFIPRAGKYVLRARNSHPVAQDLGGNSIQFTVGDAGRDRIVFLGNAAGPSPRNIPTQIAGQPFTVAPQFAIQDIYGNVVTDANDLVGIDGLAPITSGTTLVSAVHGIVQFPGIAINVAGNYVLTATDVSTPTLTTSTANTNAFDVLASSPYRLVVTNQWGPGIATFNAGQSLDGTSPGYTVQVQDAQGNPALLSQGQTLRLDVGLGANPTGAVLQGRINRRLDGGAVPTPATITFTNNNVTVVNPNNGTGRTPYTIQISGTISPTAGGGQAFGLLPVQTVPFNINPDTVSAATLVFTTEPAAVNSASDGNPAAPVHPTFAVVLKLQDPFGNPLTATTDTLSLDLAPGVTAGFAGTTGRGFGPNVAFPLTGIAFVNGVAVVNNLHVSQAGIYQLAAATTGLATATSHSFLVTPNGQHHLDFLAPFAAPTPPAQTAGVGFTPSVQVAVKDEYGNTVTSANDSVTIAIGAGSPAGVLSGPTTVSAAAGIATFPSTSINLVGTNYTLLATATGMVSDTSAAFDVNAASNYHLVITSQWASGTNFVAGAAITPLTVEVRDASNNLISSVVGDTSTLSIGLASNPTGVGLSGTLSSTITGANPLAFSLGTANVTSAGLGYTISVGGTVMVNGVSTNLATVTTQPFNVIADTATARFVFTAQPPAVVQAAGNGGPFFSVAVALEDANGNLIAVAGNQVSLTLGPAVSAPFAATTSVGGSVSLATGFATLGGIHVSQTGVYTLTATKTLGGGSATVTSIFFKVTPAAGGATSLVFFGPVDLTGTPQIDNQTAAVAFNDAVQFAYVDSLGNVTSLSRTVTLSETGPGALSGSINQTAIGGVVTFPGLSLDLVGSYTIQGDDGIFPTANTNTFTVVGGAPVTLAFTNQPTNTQAGLPILAAGAAPINVVFHDAGGNTVPGPGTTNVYLALGMNPGLTSLMGATGVGVSGGSATFNPISVQKVGTGYTLIASAAGMTSAESSTFNIAVNTTSAQRLVFTSQPPQLPTTVIAASAQTISVKVQDIFGNDNTTNSFATTPLEVVDESGNVLGNGTVAAGNVATVNWSHVSAGVHFLVVRPNPVVAALQGTGPSLNFTVVADPATARLVWNGFPIGVGNGVPFSSTVVISVRDVNNNVVTTASAPVTLSVFSPAGPNLTGVLSAIPVNGFATFAPLTLTTVAALPQVVNLNANSALPTPNTQQAFSINPGSLAITTPANSQANAPFSLTVTATDQGGHPAPNIQVSLSISSGRLFGNQVGNTDASGRVVFNSLSIQQSGNYQITASAVGYSSATTNIFTIAADQSSLRCVFTNIPISVPASSVGNFGATFELRDQFGNLDTSPTHNADTFQISVNGLSFSPQTTAVNGIVTFNNTSLRVTTSGVYTLTATDLGPGIVAPGVSGTFVVSAASAARLVFVVNGAPLAPISATAGFPIQDFDVRVVDALGNIVTTSVDPVTLSGAPFVGTIQQTPLNGIAHFSGLVINTITGSPFTVAANNGVGQTSTPPGGPSDLTINVAAATGRRLSFTTQPNSASASGSANFGAEVTTLDANGNLVTLDGVSVTLTLLDVNTDNAVLFGLTTQPTGNFSTGSGIADFNSPNLLSMTKAGTYRLLASSPGFVPAVSSTFTISAQTNLTTAQFFFVTPPLSTVSSAGANNVSAVVGVMDQFGNPFTPGAAATVQMATQPPTVTTTGNFDGSTTSQVSLSLTVPTAGAYVLALTETTGNGIDPNLSSVFLVQHTTATQLVFLNGPAASVNNGSAFPGVIQVALRDAQGNNIVESTGSVTLAPAAGSTYSVSGQTTANLVNGVATFSNVIVTDTTNTAFPVAGNSLEATSGAITQAAAFAITQSPLHHLEFVAIGGQTAGSAFAVTVRVLDAQGNLVAGDTTTQATLSFGSNPSGSALQLAPAVQTAAAGLITFSVTIPKSGVDYTLVAASPTLGSTSSGTFTVGAGTATTLVWSLVPTSIDNDASPTAFSVTLQAVDAFGNVDPTVDGVIDVQLTPGAVGTLTGTTVTLTFASGVATGSLTITTGTVGEVYQLTTLGASAGTGAGTVAPPNISVLSPLFEGNP